MHLCWTRGRNASHGFVDDVRWVLQQTPEYSSLPCSRNDARCDSRIADQYLKDPLVVSFSQENRTATTIRQRAIVVERSRQVKVLTTNTGV